MNNVRRKKLKESIDLLNKATNIIEEIKEAEEEAYDNLSDGLQQTMRGEQMYENIGEMEDALNSIQEALEYLEVVD